MLNIFAVVLKMSITASLLALVLLPCKSILQRLGFPRRILCLLWIVIAFRLICPVTIPSSVSILNIVPQSELALEQNIDAMTAVAGIESNNSIRSALAPFLYFTGMSAVLIYAAISSLMLKRKLRFAVKIEDNVYISDNVPTSFVFGIIKPKIYLGNDYSEEQRSCVIAHEKAHIRRLDHITKPIAFLILAVHWFNPFVWLMYYLFSQDIELACDEAASQSKDFEKKAYLDTLLDAAVSKKSSVYFKVCFSASPARRRIRNLLNLKKHSKSLSCIAVLICLVSAAVFCTNSVPDFYHASIEKQFSYKTNLHDKIYGFRCNDNGKMDIHFNMNGESIVRLLVTDSKTGEVVEDANVLAGKGSTYTLYDLTPKRSYDIELKGDTTWKLEGKFIID